MADDSLYAEVRVLLLCGARAGGAWRDRGWTGVVRADEAQALVRRGWAVPADAQRADEAPGTAIEQAVRRLEDGGWGAAGAPRGVTEDGDGPAGSGE